MRIMRYKVSSLFLIFGITVCIASVLIGQQVMDNMQDQRREANGYKYTAEAYMEFNATDNVSEELEMFEYIDNLNIKTEMTSVFVDEADELKQCDVILRSDYDERYPMISGKVPDLHSKNREVAVGRKIMDYAVSSDEGDYIFLNGDKYLITGVIGAKSSQTMDYSIVFSYGSLSAALKEKFSNDSIYFNTVHVQSESDDLFTELSKIVDDEEIIITDTYRQNSQMQVSQTTNSYIYTAIYVFGILMSAVAAIFFIEQRLREISIRKTFGFDNKAIVKIIFAEVTVYIGISFLLGIISLCIFDYFIYGDIIKWLIYMKDIAIKIMVYIIITIMAVFTVPLIKALRIKPFQGTKLQNGI